MMISSCKRHVYHGLLGVQHFGNFVLTLQLVWLGVGGSGRWLVQFERYECLLFIESMKALVS